MATNDVPALLLATRDRLLTSPVLAALVASGDVGQTAGVPWVFTEYTNDGQPIYSGPGRASVSLFRRAQPWTPTNTGARFPVVGVDVIATGKPNTSAGEWQAHNVAQALADWLDDPARERQTGAWTHGVYVASCRWDGSLTNAEMENQEGVYRSEFSIELELV